MSVADHIKAGRLTAALDALQNQIRANGAEAQLRLSLVQLLCVMGNWERARTQLQALSSLGDEYKTWTAMMGQALLGEALRRDVFAGRTTPLVLGEPAPWIAQMIQAIVPGDPAQRAAVRAAAFEAAPATPVKINGQDAPWVADADSRLGPILEAIMEGKYYWIPFERIKRLSIALPTDLRHLVWIPAQATWTSGGESAVLIPVRYPASEAAADDRLRLARMTTWEELDGGQAAGVGQRMIVAGDSEYPLLEIRTLEMIGG